MTHARTYSCIIPDVKAYSCMADAGAASNVAGRTSRRRREGAASAWELPTAMVTGWTVAVIGAVIALAVAENPVGWRLARTDQLEQVVQDRVEVHG
jgi:hypothetical protein